MYSIKYRNINYMLFGWKDAFKFDVDYFNEYIKLHHPLKKGDTLFRGFRTAPFSLKKPEGEYRIVALGGSSVYGLHCDYKESWPYILERKLNQQLTDREYKAINTGIPGQTSYGVDRLFTDEVLSWDPDMIILYSLFNHVDIEVVGFYKKSKLDYIFRLIKGIFYDKSLLMTHVVDFIGARAGVLKDKLDKYRFLLTDIIKKCKERNIRIIIIKQLIQPESFDFEYSNKCARGENVYYEGKYYEFLKVIDGVCKEYDTDIVDFSASSPLCRDRINEILSDKKVHLSASGKELLSDVVATKIVTMRKLQIEKNR